MILEGAIGDAYGAGFEFAERAIIETKNTLTQYEPHPIFPKIHKKYTDDTQMAIALAELLLTKNDWDELLVANKFVEVFKRDVREGYAKRFFSLLNEVKSGEELIQKIIPKSERNGAAMRAYPLVVLKNEEEILEKSSIQARVTHQTEKAIQAAQAIALASHFFIYKKGEQQELVEYLNDIQKVVWRTDFKGEVKIDAIQTVEAVLTILSSCNSLKQMLKDSVNLGGDVDTVASLTLAIGSMDENIENNLPKWLYEELENEKFGRDFIIDLDRSLKKLIA